jgi:hypothetical protein
MNDSNVCILAVCRIGDTKTAQVVIHQVSGRA